MQPYRDTDGDSNVHTYEIGNDYIIVEFKHGRYRFYKYTYARTGMHDVEEMKRLAHLGEGLNSFIARRQDYDSRW
jgi:hypothetical protein